MPDLLLIPTSLERRVVERYLRKRKPTILAGDWNVELCGFGLVAAAACTSRAISQHRPTRVLLLGIAGSLRESLPPGVGAPGTASAFDTVTCHGIGVGESFGSDHLSANEMGWAHCEANRGNAAIGDTIAISPINAAGTSQPVVASRGCHLLSVTTASADEIEADLRRQRYPDVMAEDMEGYAVALACTIADVPFQIVRGFSNRAGDRDHASWKIDGALCSAVDIAVDLMGEKW